MGYQPEHADVLMLCCRAAKAAAEIIRAAAPRARSIDWRAKSPTDFVSEVDLAAEEQIVALFQRELPEAQILAEESANSLPADQLLHGLAVVIDPLDGTTNFLHGYPEYGVSIAVLRDGEPIAGVVYDVPGDELFTATAGGGAWLAGKQCHVSTIADPQRALIGTGFPFKDNSAIAPYQEQMSRVMAGVSGVRRPGAASIDLASVASGRFDAFWETILSPWDFAAGMLLVREAGGRVTDLEGNHLQAVKPSGVLAGNGMMHSWLKNEVGGQRSEVSDRSPHR